MNNAQLITYYDHIQVPKNALLLPPNTISHDDLDMKYASNKTFFTDNAFIEAFTELEHLRLYFDFDSISNPDELDEALSWLDSLKSVFGEYTHIQDIQMIQISLTYTILDSSKATNITYQCTSSSIKQ